MSPPCVTSFLLFALALLAACATLNEDQCRAGNWYDIGVRDGANGRSLDFILQHAKACNEFGIAPKAGTLARGARGRAEAILHDPRTPIGSDSVASG